MKKKIYHLSTCDTCKRIIKEIDPNGVFELQNIKENHIEASVLDQLKQEHGTYELLFNKRARKYRLEGLHQKDISEDEFRNLILGEYTFLKRPVIIIGDRSFVGNAKKTVLEIKEYLQSNF